MKLFKLLVYSFAVFCFFIVVSIYLYYFSTDLQHDKEFTLQLILTNVMLLFLNIALMLLIMFVHIMRKPSGWVAYLVNRLTTYSDLAGPVVKQNLMTQDNTSPIPNHITSDSSGITPDSNEQTSHPDYLIVPVGSNNKIDSILEETIRILESDEPNLTNSKNQNTEENAHEDLAMIRHLLERKRVYLDKHITIEGFAEAAGISKNELSNILRERYNTRFTQLINKYRVKHAVAMLADKKNINLKVEYIGWESGFSSRSTFYNTFAHYNGMPPTDFRQRLLPE